MNRRVGAIIGVSVLVFGGLAGCTKDSSNSIDRDEFISQLTSDGLFTEEQATCLADGLDNEGISLNEFNDISEESLNSGNLSEVSAEDQQKLSKIMLGCMGLGDADVSIPDDVTSSSDGS